MAPSGPPTEAYDLAHGDPHDRFYNRDWSIAFALCLLRAGALSEDHEVDDQLEKRITRVEWMQERQEERLDQGAEAFSTVRQTLADMAEDTHRMSRDFQAAIAPSPLPWRWLAAFGFTVLCAFAGGVWTLARYPDRAEFVEVQKSNNASHKAMQDSLGSMRKDQDSSLSAIDEKLDALLDVEGVKP